MNNLIIITGCSGGGKSTLIAELHRRGYATVDEPGRRVVARELANDGSALPWVDLADFAREAIKLAEEDHRRMAAEGRWVFFDRSLVDAFAALSFATDDDTAASALQQAPRYNRSVFVVEPWPEIFVQDDERRHSFADAVEEFDRLSALYPKLGYEWIVLPRTSVAERAGMLLATITAKSQP